MSEYNIKVSKLEDGSYKLKINNYSRYEVEEVEALAIKYLQKQLQQKENIIKEVREYIENNSYFKDNVVKTMIFKDYSNGILEILDKDIEIEQLKEELKKKKEKKK